MTDGAAARAAAVLAVGRLSVGLVALAAPDRTARLLLRRAAAAAAPTVAMFGIRDAVLAAWLLRSLGAGTPARSWILAGAACDAADAAIVLRHREAFGRRAPVIVLAAAAGAAAGTACAAALDGSATAGRVSRPAPGTRSS